MLDIGPGVFDLGTVSLWPTNKVIIRGGGRYATWLLYQGDEHIHGTAIQANTDCLNAHLSILLNGRRVDQTAIGALSDSPNNNFTGTNYNFDLRLIGGAHSFQLNPTNPRPVRIVARHCEMYNVNAPGEVLVSNGTLDIADFYAEAAGKSPGIRKFNAGFQNFGGTLCLRNGTVHVVGDAQRGHEVYGVTSLVFGSSSVAHSTNVLEGVLFDVSSLKTTPFRVADIAMGDHSKTYVTKCKHVGGGTNTLVIFATGDATVIGVSPSRSGLRPASKEE